MENRARDTEAIMSMCNVWSCTQKDGVKETLGPIQYLETKKKLFKRHQSNKRHINSTGLRVRLANSFSTNGSQKTLE